MMVVGAIIRSEAGEYLLQQRDEKAPSFKNCWTLFGGIVEDGEEPEVALMRELQEEIQLPHDSIQSCRQIQRNVDANGTIQLVFEIITSVTLGDLVLSEGQDMQFVAEGQLFDREFAFNIEDVLRAYIAGQN